MCEEEAVAGWSGRGRAAGQPSQHAGHRARKMVMVMGRFRPRARLGARRLAMGPLRQRMAAQMGRAESALEREDFAELANSWLVLAAEQLPAKEEHRLGYRPIDRLSGFDELALPGGGSQGASQGLTEVVEAAVSRAATSGDPWASWAMAQRCRHKHGAATLDAIDHARTAAAGGIADAQATLGDWLLASMGGVSRSSTAVAGPEEEGWQQIRRAAAQGHRAALYRERARRKDMHWSPVARAPISSDGNCNTGTALELEWGAPPRYSSDSSGGDWEGRGRLPLQLLKKHAAAGRSWTKDTRVRQTQLEPEPCVVVAVRRPRGCRGPSRAKSAATTAAQQQQQNEEDDEEHGFRQHEALTAWTAAHVTTPLLRKHAALRVGVAASLAEQLHQQHHPTSAEVSRQSTARNNEAMGDDDWRYFRRGPPRPPRTEPLPAILLDPLRLEKHLQLRWVFASLQLSSSSAANPNSTNPNASLIELAAPTVLHFYLMLPDLPALDLCHLSTAHGGKMKKAPLRMIGGNDKRWTHPRTPTSTATVGKGQKLQQTVVVVRLTKSGRGIQSVRVVQGGD